MIDGGSSLWFALVEQPAHNNLQEHGTTATAKRQIGNTRTDGLSALKGYILKLFPSHNGSSIFRSGSVLRCPSRNIEIAEISLREAKPGGFPNQEVAGQVLIGLRTLSGLFLVGALRKINRPRKRERTNQENSEKKRKIPGKIGKVPKRTKREKKKTKKGG